MISRFLFFDSFSTYIPLSHRILEKLLEDKTKVLEERNTMKILSLLVCPAGRLEWYA